MVEDIPTTNPYHIDYIRKARGVLKIREQYWQMILNLIFTTGLNDTKDFNNSGFYRRNTPKEFIKHCKMFKHLVETDEINRNTIKEEKLDFENYGLLHMKNNRIEKHVGILEKRVRAIEDKYKDNPNILQNNKYYLTNIANLIKYMKCSMESTVFSLINNIFHVNNPIRNHILQNNWECRFGLITNDVSGSQNSELIRCIKELAHIKFNNGNITKSRMQQALYDKISIRRSNRNNNSNNSSNSKNRNRNGNRINVRNNDKSVSKSKNINKNKSKNKSRDMNNNNGNILKHKNKRVKRNTLVGMNNNGDGGVVGNRKNGTYKYINDELRRDQLGREVEMDNFN